VREPAIDDRQGHPIALGGFDRGPSLSAATGDLREDRGVGHREQARGVDEHHVVLACHLLGDDCRRSDADRKRLGLLEQESVTPGRSWPVRAPTQRTLHREADRRPAGLSPGTRLVPLAPTCRGLVDAASPARLATAQTAGLKLIEGGRLELRPFSSPITRRLSAEVSPRLRRVPWPRVYADLRDTGVRGEEAAEHLREVMTTEPR